MPEPEQRKGDSLTACTYCKKPCDGTKRDAYGELVMGVDLPVCDECSEDFENEDGPWNDWD